MQQAYGGVVLDREERVLLLAPRGGHAGYAWTFPKGVATGGESPEATAVRRVREETGWDAEVVESIPGEYEGSATRSRYYVMRATRQAGDPCPETESLQWAEFDEAEGLIQKTKYARGRTRDRAVLSAAREGVDRLALENCRRRLLDIEFGEPLYHYNLTVFPIIGHENGSPPYDLLKTAIEQNTVVVEEVDPSGVVGTLRVRNLGKRPVLIVEGEMLLGAKQNRVVNMTVLVGPGRDYELPVSCVEQGRWRHMSQEFAPAPMMAPPVMRAHKTESVRYSMRAGRGAVADQHQVWEDAVEVLEDMDVASPTGSVTDGFTAREEERQDYRKHITLPREACGAIIMHGERVLGMDLFGDPRVMREFWPQLSEAYFLEAARRRDKQPPCGMELARAFVELTSEGLRPAGRRVGLGTTLEVGDDRATGFALWYADAICHVSAFPVGRGDEHEPPHFNPNIR